MSGNIQALFASGKSLPAFRSAGTVALASSTTLVVGLPSSWNQGDLLVLAVNNAAAGNVATPSGWSAASTSSGSKDLFIFYKFAGASESAPSLTVNASAVAATLAYSNVTAIDAIGATAVPVSSVTTGTITTTANNDLVLSVFGSQTTNVSWTSTPAGVTLRVNSNTNASNWSLLVAEEIQAAKGNSTGRSAQASSGSSGAVNTSFLN